MFPRFLLVCSMILSVAAQVADAGIIDDLADGEHIWTSTQVGISDSLLEMSDLFTADGSVSFNYSFRHFVGFAGQTHRAHSGAGKIDVGTTIDAVSYNYNQAEKVPSDVFMSGSVSNLTVSSGDVFYFKANTLLTNTFNLSQAVTLSISSFDFEEALPEGPESSVVPEPSAIVLLTLSLVVIGIYQAQTRRFRHSE